MLKKPRLGCFINFKKEAVEEYIQRAKEIKPTYKYNEKWAAYTQSISSSKPYNLIVALFSVFPALSQIITLFKMTYLMKSCVQVTDDDEGQKIRTTLKFSECLALNNESLYVEPNTKNVEIVLYLSFFVYALMYLLHFVIIKKIFVQSKYLVKMLGIGVRITKSFTVENLCTIFVTILNQVLLGIIKSMVHEIVIRKTHPNDPLSILRFEVAQSNSSVIVSTIQLTMIFSCFFSILYKAYKDPCSFYIKVNDFLHLGTVDEFSFSNMNYIIESRNSVLVVQRFFKFYKKEEEEMVILLAALEYLKDCDVVITKERNKADSIL